MKPCKKEWFEEWFDDLYLQLYSHRDSEEAEAFVKLLAEHYPDKINGKILDLACGAGRHSFMLKKHYDCDVTALDLSHCLLNTAKENISGLDAPKFVRGDIRELPFKKESFDLILNMFTSFGYFLNEKLLVDTLTGIAYSLKADGLFVLDLMNKQSTIRNLVENDEVDKGKYHIKNDRSYNDLEKTVRKTITIYENGHQSRKITESVRVFDEEEIRDLLDKAGLNIINICGNYNSTAYDSHLSDRMIVLSGKKNV